MESIFNYSELATNIIRYLHKGDLTKLKSVNKFINKCCDKYKLTSLSTNESVEDICITYQRMLNYYRCNNMWIDANEVLQKLLSYGYINETVLFEGYLTLYYYINAEVAEEFVISYSDDVKITASLWEINQQWYSDTFRSYIESRY